MPRLPLLAGRPDPSELQGSKTGLGRGHRLGGGCRRRGGTAALRMDGMHCRPKRRLHGWCGAGLIAAMHSQRAHFSRSCSALPCSFPSPPAACPAAVPFSLSLAGALHPNVRIAAASTTNSSRWGRQGLLLEEAGRHIGRGPSWGAPGDPTAMCELPRLLITACTRLQGGPGRAFLPRHDAGRGWPQAGRSHHSRCSVNGDEVAGADAGQPCAPGGALHRGAKRGRAPGGLGGRQ